MPGDMGVATAGGTGTPGGAPRCTGRPNADQDLMVGHGRGTLIGRQSEPQRSVPDGAGLCGGRGFLACTAGPNAGSSAKNNGSEMKTEGKQY